MRWLYHFMTPLFRGARRYSAFVLAALSAACGSRNAQEKQQNDPMVMFASDSVSNIPAAAGANAGTTFTEKDLENLNLLLRDYVRVTRKVPKDLNELVSSGFVPSLPSPPPGKAFAIIMHPLGYQVAVVNP